MKNKIGIACLIHRRPSLLETHLKQLSECKNKNFNFYVYATEKLDEYYINLIKNYLPNNSNIKIFAHHPHNYMHKITYAVEQDHEFTIKMDEDCVLSSSGWDRFFELIELMHDDDLFCTGAISSGIPTCDLFIKNFIPTFKNTIGYLFLNTPFYNRDGACYTNLNQINYPNNIWNSDLFFENVWKINHYYKGIHPVRFNKFSNLFINECIFKCLPQSMMPIEKQIIRDKNKYPYFCNNIFGIRTKDWKTILNSKDLLFDGFDEVALNQYRLKNNKNALIDAGIPIIHTLYNWHYDTEYETSLVNKINQVFGNIK